MHPARRSFKGSAVARTKFGWHRRAVRRHVRNLPTAVKVNHEEPPSSSLLPGAQIRGPHVPKLRIYRPGLGSQSGSQTVKTDLDRVDFNDEKRPTLRVLGPTVDSPGRSVETYGSSSNTATLVGHEHRLDLRPEISNPPRI